MLMNAFLLYSIDRMYFTLFTLISMSSNTCSGYSMKIDIDKLTEEELVDLNNRIVERLRFLAQTRAHSRMMAFKIGDRVRFQPDDRNPVTGTLVRYNKKTVTVITDDGHRWNIAPNFLKKVEQDDELNCDTS